MRRSTMIATTALVRRSITAALIVTVGVLSGCGEPTTSLDEEVTFEPRFGKGKGGGGSGNDFDAVIAFTGGSGITGDGGGPYTESVRIRTDGVLLWNIGPRHFNVDLSDQELGSAGCEGPPYTCRLPGTSGTSTTGALNVLILGATDNSQELDGNLLGMSDGVDYPAKLRTNVLLGGVEDEEVKFALSFQFPTVNDELNDPINPQIATDSDFLTITRTGKTWVISTSADPDDKALVFSRSGKGKKGIDVRDEGSFHVPFVMTVTCPTCP